MIATIEFDTWTAVLDINSEAAACGKNMQPVRRLDVARTEMKCDVLPLRSLR